MPAFPAAAETVGCRRPELRNIAILAWALSAGFWALFRVLLTQESNRLALSDPSTV